ncbi:hypothetical protein NP233_g12381 [Leucocoprinus birnbaumii]|uniref:Uncharacterized protein n=1 Tax=Leucocoprinus birnbaumii TaxID=56174 RepID=A0AAD5VIL4_9AGAR|nr:hypothetical protein NP233_g12381 [Leucocoprinus birnbaumii]
MIGSPKFHWSEYFNGGEQPPALTLKNYFILELQIYLLLYLSNSLEIGIPIVLNTYSQESSPLAGALKPPD